MKKLLTSLAVLSLLTLGLALTNAQCQAPPPPQPDSSTQQGDQSSTDAAAPGVARVSYIHGDVSSQRGDNSEWVALTQNSPVSQGDRVATGQNSRAELQLDYADILRMSGNATANITSLSRTGIQVQVGQGLVTFVALKGSEANAEIDTPNASVHPQGPGEYRILINSDSETQVIVRQGSADIATPQGSTHVDQGQMITIQGTDSPQYKTEAATGRDEWDTWNDERDHRITGASSWGKTDRYYTGSEDLDTYGTWSEVPDYGPVWTPAGAGPGRRRGQRRAGPGRPDQLLADHPGPDPRVFGIGGRRCAGRDVGRHRDRVRLPGQQYQERGRGAFSDGGNAGELGAVPGLPGRPAVPPLGPGDHGRPQRPGHGADRPSRR